MKESKSRQVIEHLLQSMDIRTDGKRPWDLKVNNPSFYDRVLSGGSLALGESYMDGWWDCDALDRFFERILQNRIDRKVKPLGQKVLWLMIKTRFMNLQTHARAFVIGKRHYDIGNDLFSLMLDRGMNYSCGYWRNAGDLDQAQKEKLDLICRKIGLTSGMTVLDIGCGWGGFTEFAARNYGAKVTGVTVSKEQAAYGQKRCEGLDADIRLMDYRKVEGLFDRIVSIGMFEHVGWKNYRTFMKVCRSRLKPDGLFLLHTIAGNRSEKSTDPWIDTYIFPNSMLPSARQICEASEEIFMIEDWHSFGQYYDKTLMNWYDNFKKNWNLLKEKYDSRFFRMWTYYLLACAASFRTRRNQLWQIVFSINGIRPVYRTEGNLFVDV